MRANGDGSSPGRVSRRAKFTRSRDAPRTVDALAADERPPRRRVPGRARGRQLSRLAGAGGGTTLPGKLLWKLDPGAIDRLAARLPRRRRRRLGDERQDDDDGDGRGDPRAAAAGSPGTAPARTSSPGVASTLLAAARRRARACSRSTRARCPRSRAASGRGRSCSATSSATSSTATASSSSSPSAGATATAALPPETVLVVNGDDPQVGDLARGRAERDRLRHRRPAPRPPGAPARGRLDVLRPLRHAVRVRGRVRRPSRRLPLPGLRSRAAAARTCARREIELRRARRRRRSRSRRPQARPALRAAAARASTTSTTRSGRPRSRRRSARRSTRSAAGLERFGAAFGRFERIAVGDRTLLDAADQEPGRRERGRAHAARGRRALARCRRAERRDRRRPGRLVDLGRRLRAAARRARAR